MIRRTMQTPSDLRHNPVPTHQHSLRRSLRAVGLTLIATMLPACETPSPPSMTSMPAQRFEVRDGASRPIAAIDMSFVDGQRSVTTAIYKGDPNDPTNPAGLFTVGARSITFGSRRFLMLYEPDGVSGLTVDLVDVLAFYRSPHDGESVSTRGRGEMSNSSKLAVGAAIGASLAKSATNFIVPTAAHPPLDELMPTQDARFVDKDQQPFLATGLSHEGDPSFAVLDDHGQLSGVVVIGANGNISVHAYDSNGTRRATAFLQQTEDSGLFLMEGGTVDYALDPNTLREVSIGQTAGALPWLGRRQTPVTFPVKLYDQRHRQLWSSP
jgi:hypothetical protein